MNSSAATNIPWPSESDDPYFSGFSYMVSDIDSKIAALTSAAANVIIPPAAMSWNASSGVFSWTGEFVIPIFLAGYNLHIPYGPDKVTSQLILNDGDKVIVTMPYSSGQDVYANFSVITGKVNWSNGIFVFGMRYGNRFISRISQVFT